MTRRSELMAHLPKTVRRPEADAEKLRIDYKAASRSLLRSILLIYIVGLVVIAVMDIIYLKTGDKSGLLFLTDMILYNAAALVLGLVAYQVTTRGWLHAYVTESVFMSVADISADAVYSVSTDSLITAWSKGAERIFGYSEEEALGQTIGIVLPDDFMDRDIEVLEGLLTDGIVTGHRTFSRRKNGDVFPSEASLSLLKTPDGDPDGLLIVTRDIKQQVALEDELHEARDELEIRVEERTAELKEANRMLEVQIGERVRAELALKESEEHFRSLIENATDIIVVVDHLGRIEYVSPSVEDVFGYVPEDLIGTNAFDLAHPDDLEEIAGALAGVTTANGLTRQAEFRFRHNDGSYLYVEGIGTSMLDDLGNIRVIINARDITDRKVADERIRALNTELERKVAELGEVNKELEAFSFSVSHDLRAPLRAIQGFSTALAEEHGKELDNDAARLLDIVLRNASQMGDLIEALLSFSRVGRQEMSVVEVDMDKLARDVVRELTEEGARCVTVTVGDLPRAFGDPVLLRGVFANLVGNAIKFSSKAADPTVEISGGIEDGEAVYRVKDNGVGFDMEYYDRLFGVFQRLHGPEDFEGTGIGLANVQRVVNRHMGRVWAESTVGRGATFFFALPSNR